MLPFVLRNAPVVVVDDDPSVRDALLLLLRIDGFEAAAFGDGESFFDSSPTPLPPASFSTFSFRAGQASQY
jgi:FixJ family two-component response regulator